MRALKTIISIFLSFAVLLCSCGGDGGDDMAKLTAPAGNFTPAPPLPGAKSAAPGGRKRTPATISGLSPARNFSGTLPKKASPLPGSG